MYFPVDFRSTFSKGECFLPFDVKQSFFSPCKPYRSETYVSSSVKEIDYVQLGIVNQAELKLQPRAFFSFYAAANTKVQSFKEKRMYFPVDFRSTFSKGECFLPFDVQQSFFSPCKPYRSETYVSDSVKEIDYVQLGIVNQA
nr:hypothetical protein [Tanacetum cinerariifolium]